MIFSKSFPSPSLLSRTSIPFPLPSTPLLSPPLSSPHLSSPWPPAGGGGGGRRRLPAPPFQIWPEGAGGGRWPAELHSLATWRRRRRPADPPSLLDLAAGGRRRAVAGGAPLSRDMAGGRRWGGWRRIPSLPDPAVTARTVEAAASLLPPARFVTICDVFVLIMNYL